MAVTKLQFRGNPLALLLPMVLLSLGHSLINSVPFQTVQGCTKKQYFDISRMICRPCGAKQQKSKDGTSCVCLPGYKLISNKGGPFIRCAKCPALQSAVTQDGWSCIRCPQGVILDNERKCRCPMGNIMVERHINGALLTQVQCQPCSTSRPSFTMPDLSAKHCIRCHETFITTTQSCDCKSNVLTILKTPTISLQNLKVSSAWFASHLKASAIACLRFANLTACQALGNMCVMTMNSINILTPSNDACGLYQTIFKKTIHLGISHSINSW
ncbi:hypothetical protein scyTo_0007312 [Scyliorhinus torazame]|uniref:TNFR-Cys domain-containing protein n=1 Tax=Scyliorhinus torazame TaxID=75743 RepID=A0A401NPY2_SCYTO|nr:hypothetical protein [Scyliorhinus torazame]